MLGMPDANLVVMGFDFGTKRIGVAIGYTLTKTANPLTTLAAKNGVPDWQQIKRLIDEWHPKALVVGIPLNMDGTPQKISQRATQFAETLTKQFKLPVHETDERLSTLDARQRIFDMGGYKALKKTAIDSIAAALILEYWMDTPT